MSREWLPYRVHSVLTKLAEPLNGVYWDDIRVPVTAIGLEGGISDPTRETDTGLLLFASDAIEIVFSLAHLPPAWREGTPIRPHVRWQKTTTDTGNVHWTMQYKKSRVGQVMDAEWTTLTASVSLINNNDIADEHLITAFGAIECPEMHIGDAVLFRVARTAPNEEDTYGADARLLEFDVSYQISSPGSRKEFVK